MGLFFYALVLRVVRGNFLYLQVTKQTYNIMAFFGLFGKKSKEEKESLDQGLQKTKVGIFEKISRAIVGKSKVDDDVLDGIEEALIASDIGVETTLKIIERLEDRVARDKFMNTQELYSILR